MRICHYILPIYSKVVVKIMCAVSGCDKKVLAKGLCSAHYWRMRAHGTTNPTPRMMPEVDRFWQKVKKAGKDECWIWEGSKCSQGYGRFSSSRTTLAHKYSWIIHNRELEPHETWENKYVIMHSCDNPSCVNPRHLSLGTSKLNAQDRDNKGRGLYEGKKGSDNWRAKIDESIAEKIFMAKAKQSDIAKQFNVSITIVANIRCGRRWGHVTKNLKRGSRELG